MESSGNMVTNRMRSGMMVIWWFGLLCSLFLLMRQHYLFSTTLFLILAFILLFFRIERAHITTRGIVMLAVLAAVASISRIPFAIIPSVQPATFMIIITGMVFGKESGFIVGALTALVSNLFLGQGPWTPWQMFAWGMIGFCSGLFRKTWLMKTMAGRILFGFTTGFLFGWMMNIWVVLTVLQEFQLAQIVLIYGSSFLFDLAHALANVFFLILFSQRMINTLKRFQQKYGILLLEK